MKNPRTKIASTNMNTSTSTLLLNNEMHKSTTIIDNYNEIHKLATIGFNDEIHKGGS